MAISIGSEYLAAQQSQSSAASARAKRLSASLDSVSEGTASDEELMEACKSFETYLVEQVVKQAKKTLTSEEEGDYMKYFGDTLTQEYASIITENSDLGIAQMLYDATKRNQQ